MKSGGIKAITPIDGRYREKIGELENYFSEFALIKYRVFVEVEYFVALCEYPLPNLKKVSKAQLHQLRELCKKINEKQALSIKQIEKKTNHDVKAVEYFLKKMFDSVGLSPYKEFIHFGLTSQDINNTSIPLSLKDFVHQTYLPQMETVIGKLNASAKEWKNIPMLARTHGQAASPTKLGKEILVFTDRLNEQIKQLKSIPFSAKFGGATGNFNAHHVAYPEINWEKFADKFVNNQLGLKRSRYTTQIEHYDNMASLFHCMARINTILIDLCRDIWMYVSMDYFKQKIKSGEVGSSAMPHKVNPIDFENAEGNLGMANALFEHLSAKLPVSRLQRDLTDSTVLRNIGIPAGHTCIAIASILKGWDKLILNTHQLKKDLDNNWAVVAEAIQTILRREGYPNPYETLKALTRTNETINAEKIAAFIDGLEIPKELKKEIKGITPHNYTGIF